MPELFPLPVSPFEYYYLADDRPEYPTTFFVELTFRGSLERGPLEGALALVLARHPLLTARLEMNGGRRPNWLEGTAPQLHWGEEGEPLAAPAELQLNLATSPGVRVWVRSGPERTRLVLQFHHACCDGLAAIRCVEELLLAYHALFDVSTPALPPLDRLRLRYRDEPADGASPTTWRDCWHTAAFWARVLARSPAVLAAPSATTPPANNSAFLAGAPLPVAVLDRSEAKRLQLAALAAQVTVNDLLLRDLFLVLAAWNREHGGAAGPIRINVPTSLRTRDDKLMPAANALGFAFVTRSLGHTPDAARLLATIHRDTEQLKRDRAGRYFKGGLALACPVPGLVPFILRRRRPFATAVLSNLGRVLARTPLPRAGRQLVVGSAVLEQFTGAPPIRPGTRAALAVTHYGDDLCLGLYTDPHCFSPAATHELLARYAAQLRASLAAAVTPKHAADREPLAAVESSSGPH